MILAASLFISIGQQAADPRAAWSEWRSGLVAATSWEWAESQTWRFGLRTSEEAAEDSIPETLMPDQETSLELRMSEDGEFLLNGTTAAPAEGIARIRFGVLVDRSGARFWSVTEPIDAAVPEWFGVRIGREALDEIYGLLRNDVLRIAEDQPVSGAEPWVEHAGRNFPAQLEAFLHPTLAAHRAATLFEVSEFERRDAEVRVRVQLRWRSGPLGAVVEGAEAAAEEAVEVGVAGRLRGLLAGLEQTRGELVFDAANGSLRSVSLHGGFPGAAFGLEQHGRLRADLNVTALRHSASSAHTLSGPPDDVSWMDLEPYLDPIRGFLQPAKEIPLITPSLPPPPPPY